jgi:hypothetical protein
MMHCREQDDTLLDNFTLRDKATSHCVTVTRLNVCIWGTKRPRPEAECQRHNEPDGR